MKPFNYRPITLIVTFDMKLRREVFRFLARLHFSAEELLLYPRRQRPRRRRRPHAKC